MLEPETNAADLQLMRALTYANGSPGPSSLLELPVSGAAIWIHTASGLSTENSGRVSAWANQAGQGQVAPASGTVGPFVVSDVLHGRPVVRFSGSLLTTPTIQFGLFSFFTVFRGWGVANQIIYELSADSSVNPGFYMGDSCAVNVNNAGISNFEHSSLSTWSRDNTWKIASHLYGGSHAQHAFRTNGTSASFSNAPCNFAAASGSTSIANVFNIGGRSGPLRQFQGEIAEIVVYSSMLSDSDRDKVECYLSQRHNISIGHGC